MNRIIGIFAESPYPATRLLVLTYPGWLAIADDLDVMENYDVAGFWPSVEAALDDLPPKGLDFVIYTLGSQAMTLDDFYDLHYSTNTAMQLVDEGYMSEYGIIGAWNPNNREALEYVSRLLLIDGVMFRGELADDYMFGESNPPDWRSFGTYKGGGSPELRRAPRSYKRGDRVKGKHSHANRLGTVVGEYASGMGKSYLVSFDGDSEPVAVLETWLVPLGRKNLPTKLHYQSRDIARRIQSEAAHKFGPNSPQARMWAQTALIHDYSGDGIQWPDQQSEFFHKEKIKQHKGAQNPPLLQLTKSSTKWDAAAARRAVKKWAKGDMKKYARAFLAVDGDPNNLSSYKLPIAKPMRNAKTKRVTLKAVPHAISAAAASLDGARGGVKLPQLQRTKARAQLARYYKKMKKTPPWRK